MFSEYSGASVVTVAKHFNWVPLLLHFFTSNLKCLDLPNSEKLKRERKLVIDFFFIKLLHDIIVFIIKKVISIKNIKQNKSYSICQIDMRNPVKCVYK